MGLFRCCQVLFAQPNCGALVKDFSHNYYCMYCIGWNCEKFTLLLQIVFIPLNLPFPHFLQSFLLVSLQSPLFVLWLVLSRSKQDASVNLRCSKACQAYDINCNRDTSHLITYTSISLPTFRDFSKPEGKTRSWYMCSLDVLVYLVHLEYMWWCAVSIMQVWSLVDSHSP